MFLLSFGRENFVGFTLSFLFLFLFGFFLGGLDCWGKERFGFAYGS